MVRYWNERIELFGPNAFLPLTQENNQGDEKAFKMGIVNLLPNNTTDDQGRVVLWIDASCLPTGGALDILAICRHIWYMYHQLLSCSKQAQTHGIVMLGYGRNRVRMRQFNVDLTRRAVQCMKDKLPFKVKCIHMCQPPALFAVIFPILKMAMGKRLADRIRLHTGSEVLESLAMSGVPATSIPESLGGTLECEDVLAKV